MRLYIGSAGVSAVGPVAGGTKLWPMPHDQRIALVQGVHDPDGAPSVVEYPRLEEQGWRVLRWEAPAEGEAFAVVRIPCPEFDQNGPTVPLHRLSAENLEELALEMIEDARRTSDVAAELLRRAKEQRSNERKS